MKTYSNASKLRHLCVLFGLVSSALATVLFACANNVYIMKKAPAVSRDFRPSSNTGVLAVALANDKSFGLIEWGIKQRGTEYYRKVSTGPIIGSRARLDWKNPPEKLVLIELPAGEYEFIQWVGYQISSDKMSIRFSIRPKVVNYIGRIYVKQRALLGFDLLIQDTSSRDIPLIQSKLPGFPVSSIVVDIAR